MATSTIGCDRLRAAERIRLECRGDRVVDAQPVEPVSEATYVIDQADHSLEVWDPDAGRYTKWDGNLIVHGKVIRFKGTRVVGPQKIRLTREFSYSRSSGAVQDVVQASWGTATAYRGRCVMR